MQAASSTRRVLFAAAMLLVSAISQAQQVTYTWTGNEATQTGRVSRNGIASSYLAAPKAFPGIASGSTAFQFSFKTFSFLNSASTSMAFFVDVLGTTDPSDNVNN